MLNIEEAWSLVRSPDQLRKLYESAAKKDPALELALARLRAERGDDRADAWDALKASGVDVVAPLVTSRLFTEGALWAASDCVELGNARTADVVRALMPKVVGPELKVALAAVLAAHGTEDDFALARKAASGASDDDGPAEALLLLARRGDAEAGRALLEELVASLKEPGRRSSSDWDRPFDVMRVLAECRLADGVPHYLAMLDTPLAVHALEALELLADPRAKKPVAAFLRANPGGTQREVRRAWPYRLGAQAVLHALGEKGLGVADAHAVLEHLAPQYYGWPKLEHFWECQRQAAHALRTRGAKADVERAAVFATAAPRRLRAEGRAAALALGRSAPEKLCDLPWMEWLAKHEGPKALFKLLGAPGVVLDFNVANALARTKNPAAVARAVDWAVDVLEGRHPLHVEYIEAEAVGPEVEAALEIAEAHRKKGPHAKRIAALAGWVARERLFDETRAPVEPAPILGPMKVTVERLDSAPFVCGASANALALSPDGKRLAIVLGDGIGRIVDAASGDVEVMLAANYRWAHDCAFSPDGALLAVGFHGGHLVLHDARTGAEVRTLKGFGGVPNGVKRVAFSPDGRWLAAGGSDGSARLFDAQTGKQAWVAERPGSFEAVAFSADSKTCVFAHVRVKGSQANELLVLDVASRRAKKVPTPFSVWALAYDAAGRLFAGGEGKELLELDARFKVAPHKKKLAQAEVVRLAFGGDVLYAASRTGELSAWNLETRTRTALLGGAKKGEADEALWGLAVRAGGSSASAQSGAVFAGGKAGVVKVFDARGAPLKGPEGEVHTAQVRGVAFTRDGGMVTAGWDGRLLRWSKGARLGTKLLHHDSRLTALTLGTNGERVLVGGDGVLFAIDLVSGKTSSTKLKGRVEDLALRDGHLAVGLSTDAISVLLESTLKEKWRFKLSSSGTAVAWAPDGRLFIGTEAGWLGELSTRGEMKWARAEHGADLVDKDPLGNPHRTVVGVAVHGGRLASFSNDDTLRVFDVDSKERLLRVMADGGLFNSCAFSPSGKLIAASSAHGLVLVDASTGAVRSEVTAAALPGAGDTTVLAFRDESTIVLGTESGGLYVLSFA